MKNIAFKLIGNLVITAQNDRPMTDEESQACLAFLKSVDPSSLRMLVVTSGGAPTAAQRKSLNDVIQGKEMISAIVTDVIMVRGVVTAMGWFNKKIKAFSFQEFDSAFRYLELPEGQFSFYRAEVQRLQEEVRVVVEPKAVGRGHTR